MSNRKTFFFNSYFFQSFVCFESFEKKDNQGFALQKSAGLTLSPCHSLRTGLRQVIAMVSRGYRANCFFFFFFFRFCGLVCSLCVYFWFVYSSTLLFVLFFGFVVQLIFVCCQTIHSCACFVPTSYFVQVFSKLLT